MTPKHSIDTTASHLMPEDQGISVEDLTVKINPAGSVHSAKHNHKHHKDAENTVGTVNFTGINDTLQIIKGNPSTQEVAVLAALFTVFAARDKAIRATRDNWPSPHPDAAMRNPFGTFTRYRTNLRWW